MISIIFVDSNGKHAHTLMPEVPREGDYFYWGYANARLEVVREPEWVMAVKSGRLCEVIVSVAGEIPTEVPTYADGYVEREL